MAKTQWHTMYKHPAARGLVFTEPSKTIPGQSMTVLQIMQRQQQGLYSVGMKEPLYFYDDETGETTDIPGWEKLDISEKQQYIIENRKKIKRLQAELEAASAQAALEAEELRQEELKARKAEMLQAAKEALQSTKD